MAIQLDFFKEQSEIDILEEQLSKLERSLDKQRKSLYARHGELAKSYVELTLRLEILERNICKGN